MKRTLLALVLVLGLLCFATAASAITYEGYTQEEFDALEETTVIASPDSPSGYFVTFRYKDAEADRVRLYGEWQLSNDAYAMTSTRFSATDWQDGYFAMGSETFEMIKNEETGVWSYTLPLGSGTWSYRFFIGGEGNSTWGLTGVCDPANPPFSSVEGDTSHMSQIYVPYGENLTLTTDRSVEGPRDGENGEKLYITIDTATAGEQTFGLYIPYGYDANRAEPYPVLVLMHGSGGDETDWFTQGATANIMDNLVAEGKTEPAFIVMPNGTTHDWNEDTIIEGYQRLSDTILNSIFPYLEENYNIATDASGRALTGLSRGGRYTLYNLFFHTEEYAYFCAQSGGIYYTGTSELTPLYEYDLTDEALQNVTIELENAWYDSVFYQTVKPFVDILNRSDVEYSTYMADGAHNWYFWRQALEHILTDVLWK